MKTLLIVKIGSDDRPAQQEDIDAFTTLLDEAIKNGQNIVVTHHAVTTELVELQSDAAVAVKAA